MKLEKEQTRKVVSAPRHHLTVLEIKVLEIRVFKIKAMLFVSTLALAAIAMILGLKDPVIWGFLGTALGISVGEFIPSTNGR